MRTALKHKKMKVWDNGGKTLDRYTIVFWEFPVSDESFEAIAADKHPMRPLGFYEHTEAMPGPHLGKRISFKKLPKELRTCLLTE